MVSQTSTLHISKSALAQNLRFIRRVIGKKPKLSCVVKGNAYGHGIKTYVPLAEELGMDHFSVFSDYEAHEVLKASQKKSTILIMGMVDNKNMTWVLKNDIEFFIFEIDRLKKAIQSAKKIGKSAQIHLELETGMNRTGLDQSQLEDVIDLLKKNEKYVSVKGVCTHYAGAESISNYYRVQKQIKKFNRLCAFLESRGIRAEIKHTACSAASVVYPKTRMDMVRIGIMQYGFWPSDETFMSYIHRRKNKKNPLMPILSWKSRIMSVKEVSEGEFIGYGDSFLTHSPVRIGIVPVGYSNGYSRILSNKSHILVDGHRVSVIGAVNMNLLIINISHLSDVQKGDEVVLVGKQGSYKISFASFREQKDALNYEVLARLPDNLPRFIEL